MFFKGVNGPGVNRKRGQTSVSRSIYVYENPSDLHWKYPQCGAMVVGNGGVLSNEIKIYYDLNTLNTDII